MQTKVITRTTHSVELNGQELELTHWPYEIIVEKDGDRTIVGYLANDEDCQNPTEDDGFGKIHSLNRRHRNRIDYDQAMQILEDDKDAVALSYFEHGLCKWGVRGTMGGMPDFNWDGTSFAGVWVPDDCVRESYTGQDGKTREQWMVEQAASACETYTDWCNGLCYGVCVDVFDVKGEKVEEDACWGHIGYDYAMETLRSEVNRHAKKGLIE